MKDAVRQTRSYLMELFERHGFNPRGDFGQNFLIDLNILEYIVEQGEIGKQDVVLEVGSGTGGMTTFMALKAAHVVSVDIDKNMYELASEAVGHFDNVTLINQDVLKNKNNFAPEVVDVLEQKLAESPDRRLKLVANLPYAVATPVISNLVASNLPWERQIVTIQLELAQRMIAKPKQSAYGALSVWLQSQCRVRILKRLPPTVFWPRPKVNSAVVRLVPDAKKRKQIADRPFFQDFLRRVFSQRRKRLRGVVHGMYRKQLTKTQIDEIQNSCGMKDDARAEQLRPDKLVQFANRLYEAVQAPEISTPETPS